MFVEVGSVTKNADETTTISGDLGRSTGAGRQGRHIGTPPAENTKPPSTTSLTRPGWKTASPGRRAPVSAVGPLGTTTLSPSAFTETGGDYPQARPRPRPQEASALQTNPARWVREPPTSAPETAPRLSGEPGFATSGTGDPLGTDGSFIAATNLSQATPTNNGIFTREPPGEKPVDQTPLLQAAPNNMPLGLERRGQRHGSNTTRS